MNNMFGISLRSVLTPFQGLTFAWTYSHRALPCAIANALSGQNKQLFIQEGNPDELIDFLIASGSLESKKPLTDVHTEP